MDGCGIIGIQSHNHSIIGLVLFSCTTQERAPFFKGLMQAVRNKEKEKKRQLGKVNTTDGWPYCLSVHISKEFALNVHSDEHETKRNESLPEADSYFATLCLSTFKLIGFSPVSPGSLASTHCCVQSAGFL